MLYDKVAIESFGYVLPEEVLTSTQIETRLRPFLPASPFRSGTFEQLTGIKERRLWPVACSLEDEAAKACEKALSSSDVAPADLGMVIYAGVFKTLLEPATACGIADKLGVPQRAQVYDVSNACLGVLNGIIQVANAIQLGDIDAGLVVAFESSREIIDSVFRYLEHNSSGATVTKAFPTFTLGSAAVAVVLRNRRASRAGHALLACRAGNAVRYQDLCWVKEQQCGGDVSTRLMQTDSVNLFKLGKDPVLKTYLELKEDMRWSDDKPDRAIFHQIGRINHDLFHRATKIPLEKGFETFSYLGNTGSAALPITAAIASEKQFFRKGDHVCFLGMGSGINCLMLAIEW